MRTYTSASESATAMKGNDSPISIFTKYHLVVWEGHGLNFFSLGQ